MKNQTQLKTRNPFSFVKNWRVGFLLFATFFVGLMLLLFISLILNSEEPINILSIKNLKFLLLLIMFVVSYLGISISQKTSIVVNDQGIHQSYAGSMLFVNRDYSYSWQDIESITIKKIFQAIEIKIKNQSKKIKIPYFLWEIDHSSVEFNLIPVPKTNMGKAKFDINETAIVKTLNHWKPELLFPDAIIDDSNKAIHADLGKKIQTLAFFAIAGLLVYLVSMPLSDEIQLQNGYFWKMWLIFSYVYLMLALFFTQNELKSKEKTKVFGAVLVSLLAAGTLSSATAGVLEIYTKHSKNTEVVTFSLVNTTEKKMIWESDKPNWKKINIQFEYDYEKEIQIGDSIELTINKGPYDIYSTSLENFDKATSKYNLDES